MATHTVQQVLAGQDDTTAAELLFTLLEEQAQGRELSSVVADVAQGVLRGRWSVHVKRLAYDLCKAAPLSDADSQYVIAGIRSDLSSGDWEHNCLGLSMLPHVPPHLLAGLLSTGELAQLLARPLSADAGAVRASAVSALASVLLVPEVLHAASGSAGMANQVNEHWQTLTDALLDEDDPVVSAALTSAVCLLRAGLSADVRLPEGFLVDRLAAIAAARISSALGPVLHAADTVPVQSRVDLLTLLQLLVEHAARAGHWSPADVGGAAGLPSGTVLPGLTALAPTAWGYCAGLLHSGDAPLRMEAARAVLRVAALVARAPPSLPREATRLVPSEAGAAGGGGRGGVPQPTGLVLEAVSALLELEDCIPLVEAAAEDIIGAVVEGLPALGRRERANVLMQLWAGVGRIKNTPTRMELWARTWAAIVQDDDPITPSSSPEATTTLLSNLLHDPYISAVMANKSTLPTPSLSFRAHASGSSTTAAAAAAAVAAVPAANPSPPRGASTNAVPVTAAAASTEELMNRPSGAVAPGGHAGTSHTDGKETRSGVSRFFKLNKKDGSSFGGSASGGGAAGSAGGAAGSSVSERALARVPSMGHVSNSARTAGAAMAQAAEQAVAAVSEMASNLMADTPSIRSAPVASFGSQRHELTAALLAVVQTCHPAASLAYTLSGDVAYAQAHDQQPASVLTVKYGAWPQQKVLSWITVARTVLQNTQSCMLWEALVIPAVSPHIQANVTDRPPADFSTTVQDAWLQLLQAAAAAARALQTLVKPQQPPAPATVPEASGGSQVGAAPSLDPAHSVNTDGGSIAGTPRSASNSLAHAGTLTSALSVTSTSSARVGAPGVTPLLLSIQTELREITNIMKQVLREWGTLSRAVRPRALWVVCHSMDMAPHADELWEHGLRALQDVLCKLVPSGNVARTTDLLSSAAQGVLFRSGRVGWSRDRPFVFDAVAASALCERPDYDATSLVVGLMAAQAWTTRLQDALAMCPAESSKRVLGDVVFQAGRLEAIIREFMGTPDAAGSPILREWAKRVTRALAAAAMFVHPAARALEEAELAAKAAAERAEKEAEGNGYDPSATIHSSSSSEAGDIGNLLPVSLPTAMYLPPGGNRPPPPPALPAYQGGVPLPRLVEQPSDGFTSGQMVNPGSPSNIAANRDQEPFKARALQLHGHGPSHMVYSASSSHPWGYPFTRGPRASAIFYSKRSRRTRLLAAHVRRAIAQCQAAGTAAQGSLVLGQGLSSVPALPTHSPLRLDSPTFWALLPSRGGAGGTGRRAPAAPGSGPGAATGHGSGGVDGDGGGLSGSGGPLTQVVELCGPGDPIQLVGCVVHDVRDASQMVLRITAQNRSDHDIRGVVVQVLALGPAQLDRRAANWTVPRLSPRDKITHSFTMKLLGYGLVRLSVRLQPVVAGASSALMPPIIMPCKPLLVGLVQHMLYPPAGAPPSPREFFAAWATLPVRLEMAAACVWPGREGAAVALSSMLRSPLSCAMLTYTSVTATYQMALAGETATGDEVLIVVHAQLLPPPPSNSASQRDGVDDANPTANNKPKDNGKEDATAAAAAAAAASQVAAAQSAAVEDAARQPHALLQLSIRSALPDVGLALTAHASEFLADLAGGTAQLVGPHLAGAAVYGSSGPKPPLHPRLVALDAAQAQSLRALPAATAALLGGGGAPLTDVHAQGVKAKSKVSHRFMEAAAAAEWQRLVAQPV